MVTLSNFSSLFEVSIAVHLLYSLFPQIQKAFLANANLKYRYYQRAIENHERIRSRIEHDQKKLREVEIIDNLDVRWDTLTQEKKGDIKEARTTIHKQLMDFEKLFSVIRLHDADYDSSMLAIDKIVLEKSSIYIPISLLTALFSLILIIVSGYAPNWQLSWYAMALLIAISLLPMPAMLIATHKQSKKNIGLAISSVDEMGNAIQRHDSP